MLRTFYDKRVRGAHRFPDEDAQAVIDRQARELGALAALLDQERRSKRKLEKAFSDAAMRVIAGLFSQGGGRDEILRTVKALAVVDRDWYLRSHRDVAEAGADPEEHYVDFGFQEGRSPSPVFTGTKKA